MILGNSKHRQKSSFYNLLENFLGKGLITQDVDKWIVHRKILQPVFKLNNSAKFIGTFNKCADRLVNKLLEKNGEDINVTTFVNNSVYDILRETILGIPASQQYHDGEDNFRKNQVTLIYRLKRPWLLIDWFYRLTAIGKAEERNQKYLIEFCNRKMREFLQNDGSINHDSTTKETSLLEYMIKYIIDNENSEINTHDIIEQCCTFMLAGQESVATTIAITLFHLANNSKWQKKCTSELNEIFGADKRSPINEDLDKMENLEMCIKESLRLYPTVPIFARTLGMDVKLEEHIIPAGSNVVIMPYCTHRLSHHFPDPHVFKPERFSRENSENRHRCAYMPFSFGSRDCIGRYFAMFEMKSIISAILRKYQLEPVLGKEKMIPKFRVTIRAHGGLWIKARAHDK